MNINKPLISVVVPTFNRSHRIPATIETVSKQTYRPIELIFVNDGSTDDTMSILDKLTGDTNGITVKAFHKDNGGVSIARNMGISHAKGELFASLDDDDEWLPEKLEMQYDVICKADAEASLCPVLESFPNGDTVETDFQELPCTGEIGEFLRGERRALAQTLLIKRETLTKVGGFLDGMIRAQDIDFLLRVVASATLANVNKPLTLYNYTEGALSVPKRGLAPMLQKDESVEMMLHNLHGFARNARWWDESAFHWRVKKDFDQFIKHQLYCGNISAAHELHSRGVALLGNSTPLKRARRKIRKAKLLRLFGKRIKHPRHKLVEDIITH